MNKYTILVVDDEREVLDSVRADLAPLSNRFDIEVAQSADEAQEVIDSFEPEQRKLALILCDHVMPGKQGVDFLIDLHKQDKGRLAKKILLTGQAGLQATIAAVNHGHLDYYLAKPWTADGLVSVVKEQLTTYMIQNESDLASYADILDSARIFEAIYQSGLESL
jgi:DNA-binding NtrC family response regulator